MTQPIIDSHHHLWDYDPAEYAWIDPATMQVLAHDYTMSDRAKVADPCGVVGTVAVQARQSLADTDWLLQIAESDATCCGVVGWAPLRDPGLPSILERYQAAPYLKGLRHIVQDEPGGFMLDPLFQNGIAQLRQNSLVYDILIYGRQLPEAIALVDRFPEQPFVLDHAAKPTIRAGRFDQAWADHLIQLAERTNVCCKLSGLVTEVRDPTWDATLLAPYFDTVIEAFGIERVMFGSDWPVCLLRSRYGDWFSAVDVWATSFSRAERNRLFHDNAVEAYRLKVAGPGTAL